MDTHPDTNPGNHPEPASLPDAAARSAAESLQSFARFQASMEVSPQQRARLEALMVERPPALVDRVHTAMQAALEVAQLVFDSARQRMGAHPPMPGFRSASAPEARLLQFACDDGVIDLRIEVLPHADRVQVLGEASVSMGCTRVIARQHSDAQEVGSFDVAPDGYFELSLPKVVCELEFVRPAHRPALIDKLDLTIQELEH